MIVVTLVDQVPGADAPGGSATNVARAFVSRIRELAADGVSRRLDDDPADDMDTTGSFSVIVPKRWGGAGLAPGDPGAR
jgi:3-hydroxy-9,10-secoandrosta-1,3,5(10)-triene-9,17-dione monooxygenase